MDLIDELLEIQEQQYKYLRNGKIIDDLSKGEGILDDEGDEHMELTDIDYVSTILKFMTLVKIDEYYGKYDHEFTYTFAKNKSYEITKDIPQIIIKWMVNHDGCYLERKMTCEFHYRNLILNIYDDEGINYIKDYILRKSQVKRAT